MSNRPHSKATCPCGVEFFKFGKAVYCSQDCRIKGKRAQEKAYKEAWKKNKAATSNPRFSGDCRPETAQAIFNLLRNDPEARIAFAYMQAGRSKDYANQNRRCSA